MLCVRLYIAILNIVFIYLKLSKRTHLKMKWHICSKCEKTLESRQSLWRHKQNCELNNEVKDQSKGIKIRRFISDEMFIHLAMKPAVKLDNLQDTIYKLENISEINQQSVAELTDRYGSKVSVILPEFVIKRLSLTEKNVDIYLKPSQGGKDLDVATMENHLCNNCSKQFASSHTLYVHLKKHCKAIKVECVPKRSITV